MQQILRCETVQTAHGAALGQLVGELWRRSFRSSLMQRVVACRDSEKKSRSALVWVTLWLGLPYFSTGLH
eukprot:5883684-Prymnesium_polylepis.1